MHTVRNRIASRPPVRKSARADSKPPAPPVPQHEAIRRPRSTSAAEAALILGSMASEPASYQAIRQPPPKRRNPKGKKARKAAERLAAERLAAERTAAAVSAPPPRAKAPVRKRQNHPRVCENPHQALAAVSLESESAPVSKADTEEEMMPAASLLTLTAMPDLPADAPGEAALTVLTVAAAAVPALSLPRTAEPLVEPALETAPQPTAQLAARLAVLPDAVPPELGAEASALKAIVEDLPRSRALVPARRQGLVDVIAFLLRDSGRRLARWSARRQKTRAEQAALRQAEARQLNLKRELEALDALRRARG